MASRPADPRALDAKTQANNDRLKKEAIARNAAAKQNTKNASTASKYAGKPTTDRATDGAGRDHITTAKVVDLLQKAAAETEKEITASERELETAMNKADNLLRSADTVLEKALASQEAALSALEVQCTSTAKKVDIAVPALIEAVAKQSSKHT